MPTPKNKSVNTAILGIYRLLMIAFFILTLYFAQTIAIPLTIAALLTFLISPLVAKLEKWIGRIAAILFVVVILFSLIGFIGYVFAKQLIAFGSHFPTYYEIMESKFQDIHFPEKGLFHRLGYLFESLKAELFGEPQNGAPLPSSTSPIELKLIDLSAHFTNTIELVFGSAFNLLKMTGIILLLVIFMSLHKEDIRGRIIKLIGHGRISSTTQAMNDASERVFRYLVRLFIVNGAFGLCLALGLYAIGIPNAVLWGCLAAVLRFIPYVGPWIAAAIPIALSFVIAHTWVLPLLTILFFTLLEIVTAYVIEPFYYGEGTGVSSFALIVAAICWTWLWGPIGLLLSTPLTVCLVVLGQHMTNMHFLRVLLSQEQALTPAEECYHRFLSLEAHESMDLVESYLQNHSLVSLYDHVLIPIITHAETDFHRDGIDVEKRDEVYQSIAEMVDLLSMNEQEEMEVASESKGTVLCLAGRSKKDELGANILAQYLLRESYDVHVTKKLRLNELLESIEKKHPNVVFMMLVTPFTLSYARFLCAKLHQRYPQMPLVIGLWNCAPGDTRLPAQLYAAGATQVVFSLSQAVDALQNQLGRC